VSLTDTMANLGRATERQVVALHARYEAGDLDEARFVTLAVAVLVRAKARGVALADLALAAALTVLRRYPVATVGLELPTGAQRNAQEAVRTTLASDPYRTDPAAAVAVLARSEVFATTQDAYADGMRRRGVGYWERVPNADACPVCQDLSEGVVAADVQMWRHKGCGCVQRPVA
jgi:hypothetical protein